MKSAVIKRSIVIAGHHTSISLEDAFWLELREIAKARGISLSALIAEIDASRESDNLSSALRLFVFEHVRRQAAATAPGVAKLSVAGPTDQSERKAPQARTA